MRKRLGTQGVALAACIAATLVLQGAARAQENGNYSGAVPGNAFVARSIQPSEAKAGGGGLGRALWIASIAALAAANVADAKSSWNKYEGNGVLAGSGGRFGAKGVAIKGSINGVFIVSQVIAMRKHPEHRVMTIVNFSAATVFGVLAFHNSTIPGPAGGIR